MTEFKYKIGTIIECTKSKYVIIEHYKKRKYNHLCTIYLCKCIKDGYIFERTENEINRKCNCPICSYKKTVLDYNTIFDLRPDLIQYLHDPEDAKRYSPYSNKKIKCQCPICKKIKYMPIGNLSLQGFNCDYCSDHISYPNKFVRAFLDQLPIEFIPEKSFDWLSDRKYDQYIPEYNMIIENHGEQHYINKEVWKINTPAIDELKRNAAYNNSITYYIELDCRESTMQYIKNSIMNSDLPQILNFNEDDIDWEKCAKIAAGSLLMTVCDLWNQYYTYDEIIQELHICYDTVIRYIRRGKEIGIVENKPRRLNPYYGSHPIYSITDDLYFFSVSIAEKYYASIGLKYLQKRIGVTARDHTFYKDKQFAYITRQEFNEMKDLYKNSNPQKVYGEYYTDESIQKELKIVS